jgi:hypothetical protein
MESNRTWVDFAEEGYHMENTIQNQSSNLAGFIDPKDVIIET